MKVLVSIEATSEEDFNSLSRIMSMFPGSGQTITGELQEANPRVVSRPVKDKVDKEPKYESKAAPETKPEVKSEGGERLTAEALRAKATALSQADEKNRAKIKDTLKDDFNAKNITELPAEHYAAFMEKLNAL